MSPPTRWRAIGGRGLFFVGIGIAATQWLPAWPREQPLVLEFGENRTKLRRVDLSWTRRGDTEPMGGSSLSFPNGAPSVVSHPLEVPNGAYVLDIALTRSDKAGSVGSFRTVVRELTLEGRETRLNLEDLVR